MAINKKITEALIDNELSSYALNEAALSNRARSFMKLVKGVIGLDARRLIKLATGKQTGLSEAAKSYRFMVESTGQVETLAMGNNYRAVAVKAGNKEYCFLAPKRGGNRDYTDEDVITSLHDILTKMLQAKRDNNSSALNSFKSIFLPTREAAVNAIKQKEQIQGVAQEPIRASGLVKVLTPIIVQMAGKEGPAAATIMRTVTDDEIVKALEAHQWDQESIVECSRLIWGSVSHELNGDERNDAKSINTMAQTVVAYVVYKYLYVKVEQAQIAKQGNEENRKQQELTDKDAEKIRKREQDDLKNEQNKLKNKRELSKQDIENSKEQRERELHRLRLDQEAAKAEHLREKINTEKAKAEATAKRPL